MITLEVLMSNEGAIACRAELRRMLVTLADKMDGSKRDKQDTSTLAYTILTSMVIKLDAHIQKLREDEPVRRDKPTVRQQRRFR